MLLRRVARPLLAGIFIQGGIAALRDPKTHADMAAPVIDQITAIAPIAGPPSNVTLIRVDAGVKIGAGVLLALGKMPRLSSAALAATLIPTTVSGHQFWKIDDPNQRMNDEIHFMKNLALLGGLMLAAADTEGKPSLAWRARRARRTSAVAAELFHQDVTEGLGQLSERAGELTGELAGAAAKAGGQAGSISRDAASRVGERLAPVASRVGERTGQLLGDVEAVGSKAMEQALGSRTVKDARKAAKKAHKRTAKRVDQASRRASKQLGRAGKRAAKRLDRASKESSKQLDRASAKAREVRTTVGSKLG